MWFLEVSLKYPSTGDPSTDLTYALLSLITAISKVGLLHGHQYDMLTRGETVIKGEQNDRKLSGLFFQLRQEAIALSKATMY